MPKLKGGRVESKRQEILDYFQKTFALYESLYDCLSADEAFYVSSNPLRHPLIFYYGHTSVFYINKLNILGLSTERIDPEMEKMMEIGVDEMEWDDLESLQDKWPSVADVQTHRDKTRAFVENYIRNCDFTLPIGWDSPMWPILMGIEHERIHIETTSVLMRELPVKFLKPHPLWSNICRESGKAPENRLLPVEGGAVRLGKSEKADLYGWDNEYGQYKTDIAPFRASKYLVSNQEFMEFVDAGGYSRNEYWDEEGREWLSAGKARHPAYWREKNGRYEYRTMLEWIDMPRDWPVDVNYLEAMAFCRWKSEQTGLDIRMPTEAEWRLLRNMIPEDQPEWDKAPGNINLEGEMSPCPVTRHECAGGFHDIIGNVWQWTETRHHTFDGYKPHKAYEDYSIHSFDGDHNVLSGGCWISTGGYASRDVRNWFRRHFFQYAGFRYVTNNQ